jgi:hypothetical protein
MKLQAGYLGLSPQCCTNVYTGIEPEILHEIEGEEHSPSQHGPDVIVASEPTSEFLINDELGCHAHVHSHYPRRKRPTLVQIVKQRGGISGHGMEKRCPNDRNRWRFV